MKKLKFNPKTLEDNLIIDGLSAVSTLESFPLSKESCFVVGGFATQSYIPQSYRRKTSDIDLALIRPISLTEFREYSKPVVEYLGDNGYNTDVIKGHNAYELYFDKNGDAGVIEFSRRSMNRFLRTEKRLQREMDNTRLKTIHGKEKKYRVSSPEDIALPKIVRGVGTLTRNPDFMHYISSRIKPMNEQHKDYYLNSIKKLRQEAIVHVGDPARAEELRLVADIYDVRSLTDTVGFNENYFKDAANDWNVITNPTNERNKLISFLTPILFDIKKSEQSEFNDDFFKAEESEAKQ